MGKGDGSCGQRSAMTLTAATVAGPQLPDLTVMSPAQVDELWAAERQPLFRLEERAHTLRKTIRKYRKHGRSADHAARELVDIEARIDAEHARLAPFDAEWDRRGGWTRAYLCNSHDGHVHKHIWCKTLHATTSLSWLPQLSGASDDQIIGEVGHMACTICYPDAPTHPAFIKAAQQAAAEEAEKQAARCPASGTYAPEGSYNPRLYSPYAKCPQCGEAVSVTRTGKLRSHKPKAG